jgi:predicted metal-dependent HD superfamily phosphohydrolase
VELALWFHDAVYAVRNHDNEEQSASWAQASNERAGLPNAVGERLHRLILATKHDAEPTSRDAALLVDVDLAILGAAPERFDEYERQVREEYSWVPGFLFRRKRREILEGYGSFSGVLRGARPSQLDSIHRTTWGLTTRIWSRRRVTVVS